MTNFKTYKTLLSQFVKFKSISTDIKFAGEMEKTVLWLEKTFRSEGFKTKIWRPKTVNPIILAGYTVSAGAETVMIYGHYDVQPAESGGGWKSDPFSLSETKSRFFARGVIDNKGQVLIHIATIFDLIKAKRLKYNIKFLIEGNEETGNDELSKIMADHKKDLSCNVVIVSDGEMTNNKPTIEVSLRGGFNATLTFRTAKNTLHSGIWGGAVPNAAYELSKFLAGIFDKKNSLAFKEFYSGADGLTDSQIKNNKYLVKEGLDMAKLAGTKCLLTEDGLDLYTQTGLRPTIQITGFKAGYIGDGYANIIPPTAEARLNFRIVASQKPDVVAKTFEKYLRLNVPPYVRYDIQFNGLHGPVKVNTKNKYVDIAENAMTDIYKTKVNRKNVGGAIPFVGDVKKILGVDTVLIPLVNEDCNMHGDNENFRIDLTLKALEFSDKFFRT